MKTKHVNTPGLRLAYEESGPRRGEALILLHGWPDSPRTWDRVIPHLHDAGFRTVAPYIRGYGPSAFRTGLFGGKRVRTGQTVAYAQDVIDLANRLGLKLFHFIGHDWGARTGYALAALFPERLKTLTAISVPFEPGKAEPPAYPQAQAFWYQWFLCSKPGEKKFRADPVAYGRAQWEAWSPQGWYNEEDLKQAAKSWKGKDFEDVVLHAYRSRWGHAVLDPHYAKLQERFEKTDMLKVLTLLIHGAEDRCELAQTTEGAERYFAAPDRRVFVSGVGHFPTRENPAETASLILELLRSCLPREPAAR